MIVKKKVTGFRVYEGMMEMMTVVRTVRVVNG